MKAILKSLLSPISFVIMQSVGSVIMMLGLVIYAIAAGTFDVNAMTANPNAIMSSCPMWLMALVVIVTDLAAVGTITLFRMIDWKKTYHWGDTGAVWTMTAVIGTFAGIVAMNLLNEKMDLPNIIEDQMMGMSTNIVGMSAIAILGPVFEELLFREGMMGVILRNGGKAWVAILLSSLCFGLIHMNPAQIPFAFGVGILLAIIYWRTRNIVLTTILHIINNSIAVIEMIIWGDDIRDMTYSQLLGGDTHLYILMGVSAVLSLILMAVACRISSTR